MEKDLIIVRESTSGEMTATYYNGSQEYHCENNNDIKEFTQTTEYKVYLLDWETGKIDKVFYCKDKGIAMYVVDFLVIDGEEPKNVILKKFVCKDICDIFSDHKWWKPTGFAKFDSGKMYREYVDSEGNTRFFE